MFEKFTPKYKIGVLSPGRIIENGPYEFYRLAPPNVMRLLIGVGLTEFSSEDVERVFAPLDKYSTKLMDRGIDSSSSRAACRCRSSSAWRSTTA